MLLLLVSQISSLKIYSFRKLVLDFQELGSSEMAELRGSTSSFRSASLGQFPLPVPAPPPPARSSATCRERAVQGGEPFSPLPSACHAGMGKALCPEETSSDAVGDSGNAETTGQSDLSLTAPPGTQQCRGFRGSGRGATPGEDGIETPRLAKCMRGVCVCVCSREPP